MTLWLGDIEEDSVVTLPFSTHEAAGGNVAPSSALEIADIRVYKGSSATQRSSTAGMTMTSPFDSLTGVHMVEIDTSDNTDAGFWAAGNLYHVMLAPDETVDSQTLTGVHLASFGIEWSGMHSLLSTVLSRLGSPSDLGGGASVADNLTDIYDVADAVSSTLGTAGAGLTAVTNLIGTPTNLGSGATVAGNLIDIEAQTDDIGAAGAGLTAVPWNAAWDAEVQSEASDALVALGLDHLVSASVTGTDITDNSIIAKMVSQSATADWDSFVNTTDALEALRDNAGTNGASLSVGIKSSGITSASFASGAITAAAIAADAIGASELAADVINDIWQGTAITEAYATDAAAATPAQLLYMIWSMLAEKSVSGTTLTAKQVNGITTAMTFTLNDASNPTSLTRAT